MAKGMIGNIAARACLGGMKMKRGYIGAMRVYSAGNIATYHVDTDVTRQEEIDSDLSCLSPGFTPEKSGWIFAGWREDTTASGDVLGSKLMGDDPVELYAVFYRPVVVTLYNNSTSAATLTGNYYYNNGNVVVPTFTQAPVVKDGWSFTGWSTSDQPGGEIKYMALNGQEIGSNYTLYGIYKRDITVSFYNNGGNTTQTGAAYYNSSDKTTWPAFTQAAAARDGWLCRGWSLSDAAVGGISYTEINNTQFTSNTSLYTAYERTVYLYYGIDLDNYGANNKYVTGTAYYNSSGNRQAATFTVAQNTFEYGSNKFLHWAAVEGVATYNPGDTISMDGSSLAYTIVGVWEYVKPYTFFLDGKFYDKNGNEITVQRWMHHGALSLYQYRCEETGEVVSGEVLDARTEPHARMDYPNGGGDYQFKYGNNIFVTASKTAGNYAIAEVKFYNVDAAGCSKVKFTLDYHHSGDIEFMDEKWTGGDTVDRDYSWPVRFSVSDGTMQGADLGVTKIEFLA